MNMNMLKFDNETFQNVLVDVAAGAGISSLEAGKLTTGRNIMEDAIISLVNNGIIGPLIWKQFMEQAKSLTVEQRKSVDFLRQVLYRWLAKIVVDIFQNRSINYRRAFLDAMLKQSAFVSVKGFVVPS